MEEREYGGEGVWGRRGSGGMGEKRCLIRERAWNGAVLGKGTLTCSAVGE